MTVVVAGVSLVPFRTPGRSETYDVMGASAVRAALADAGLALSDIQQAYAGYVYADSAAGQTAIYGVGATGIPIVKINNYCASGSTALWLGRQAIRSGVADCVLVLGFEQMVRGAIGSIFPDRPDSLHHFTAARAAHRSPSDAPPAAQYFGDAGAAYLSSPTDRTPTAGASSPIRPADCCRRGIRSGPRVSPSAPNWSGSCAAPRGSARSREHGSPCSTTSGWAPPVWSRSMRLSPELRLRGCRMSRRCGHHAS